MLVLGEEYSTITAFSVAEGETKPKVLLLLGGVSVKSILNTNEPISKLRGQKNSYLGIETIATFHPAYLLRSPGQKAAAFKDFILLSKTINK